MVDTVVTVHTVDTVGTDQDMEDMEGMVATDTVTLDIGVDGGANRNKPNLLTVL